MEGVFPAETPIKWRQCGSCGQWLPAEAAYFARMPSGSRNRWICQACGGAEIAQPAPMPVARAKPARETSRVCTHCGEEWPLTIEFFSPQPRRGGAFITVCRACETERHAAWRAVRAKDAKPRRVHMSDAIAPLLTGAHFFAGAQIGRVAHSVAEP